MAKPMMRELEVFSRSLAVHCEMPTCAHHEAVAHIMTLLTAGLEIDASAQQDPSTRQEIVLAALLRAAKSRDDYGATAKLARHVQFDSWDADAKARCVAYELLLAQLCFRKLTPGDYFSNLLGLASLPREMTCWPDVMKLGLVMLDATIVECLQMDVPQIAIAAAALALAATAHGLPPLALKKWIESVGVWPQCAVAAERIVCHLPEALSLDMRKVLNKLIT